MKKPFSIHILEYVAAQPLSKFPIQADAEGTSDELLQEISRLEQAGLLEAHVNLDEQGRPCAVVITGITFEGKSHQEEWLTDAKTNRPLRKASRWSRDMLLLGIGFVLGGCLTKFGEYLFEIAKNHLPHP